MTDLKAFENQLNETREDVREVRTGIGKITEAITKLAVLEERHTMTIGKVEALDKRVTIVESKSSELEKAHLKLLHTLGGVGWSLRIIWVMSGAVVGGLALKYLTPLVGAH